MKAIVGLGNPGDKYVNSRHNIGFKVVDYIASKFDVKYKSKCNAHISSVNIAGEKTLLVKPQTFMNASGVSLLEVVNYYGLNLCDIIIIYDDVDLDLGKIRIRKKGSAGTHNGMRSVICQLKSEDIPRLRIGIGHSDVVPLASYVLQRFSTDEMQMLEEIIAKSADAAISFVEDGINLCMNKYNQK